VIELARLNEAERRVLWLLAEGHTAKSIAIALETTPAAVNERLREARRKTGVGSSRELARLLKAQESRHEQIGVASSRALGEALSDAGAEPWRPQTGVFAMIGLLGVVAAGAVALMSQAAPTMSNEVDPLIGAPIERGPQPADLHARIRAESRDTKWAPGIEGAIKSRLMSMPLVGKDGNALRVTCAATLCEIAGSIVSPSDKKEQEDQNSQFNRTIKELQTSPLTDDLIHLGLKIENGMFTGGKGKPDRMVFLLYYSRASAPAEEEQLTDSLVGNIFAPTDPQKAALIPTTSRDYLHAHAEDPETAVPRLHAQVRSGPRDQEAEARLAAIYKSLHPIKLSKAPLRVTCSASLCEVATTTEVPTPQAAVDATLGEVQGPDLRQRAEAMGLKPLYLWFGLHPNEDRAAYLGYWARSR
jgi:DNA-binding CsgD family transcriptional regulator